MLKCRVYQYIQKWSLNILRTKEIMSAVPLIDFFVIAKYFVGSLL